MFNHVVISNCHNLVVLADIEVELFILAFLMLQKRLCVILGYRNLDVQLRFCIMVSNWVWYEGIFMLKVVNVVPNITSF